MKQRKKTIIVMKVFLLVLFGLAFYSIEWLGLVIVCNIVIDILMILMMIFGYQREYVDRTLYDEKKGLLQETNNKRRGIQKLSDLVNKHNISSEISNHYGYLSRTPLIDKQGVVWWKIGDDSTGIWLRLGDTRNSGITYLGFWSDFYKYRNYDTYRCASRGNSKDWFLGYQTLKVDYNDLRKDENVSEKTLQELSIIIIRFYENAKIKGKNIQEIINEKNIKNVTI